MSVILDLKSLQIFQVEVRSFTEAGLENSLIPRHEMIISAVIVDAEHRVPDIHVDKMVAQPTPLVKLPNPMRPVQLFKKLLVAFYPVKKLFI